MPDRAGLGRAVEVEFRPPGTEQPPFAYAERQQQLDREQIALGSSVSDFFRSLKKSAPVLLSSS